MYPLSKCETNTEYIFLGFSKKSPYENHLLGLGLVKGTTIQILSFSSNNQMIVHFQNSRVGIDSHVAEDILVSKKEGNSVRKYMSLNDMPVGTKSVVEGILGKGAVKRRLMDMGLTKGTPILLRKVAPLGDPIEVAVRGYQLTLRKSEADLILIRDMGDNEHEKN
ncbi:FeoA domain-containing protein [Vagococcus acidifermentans]|nr:FeoA domain-containing protein [Vagococcus acidifermentans]